MFSLNILKNRAGYILVETLISVVILAFGLTWVLNAFSAKINALRTSKNYTHASLLLEKKICELETSGGINLNEWPEGRRNGKFPEDERFDWEINISHMYNEQNEQLDIVEVTLTVRWKEISVSRELDVVTYMPKIPSTI